MKSRLLLTSLIISSMILMLEGCEMNNLMPEVGMLDRFKQNINYPEIISDVSNDQKIVADWPEIFKGIKLSDKSVWQSYDHSLGILKKNHATISDFMESGDKNVNVKIHVLSDTSNKDVIEEALLMTSYTSMMDINMEYMNDGPGDFYLHYKHQYGTTGDSSAISVFKNVIIDISTTEEDTDVRPIVHSLIEVLSKSLVATKDTPKIKFKTLYSSQEIKTGDSFWVEVTVPESAKSNNYDIDLQDDPLPDGIEYVKNTGGKYYFKADKPGVYNFQLFIMDERTLITENAKYSVVVKN